ncbi:MAG: hypothetical protein IJZ16_13385 [Clostridia bacterium]|nr:hypothetical protein [Clostridia bacterium]
MSKILKKSFSIILALTMLFSAFVINSSANTVDEENAVMPCFSTIDAVATSFTISGLVATASVSMSSQYSTSLYIKIEFQKEKSTGYETLETWERSGTGTYLGLEEDRLINVFCDYRIKVTCTAGGETHVKYDYP